MTLIALLTDTNFAGTTQTNVYGESAPIAERVFGGQMALVTSPGGDPRATVRALKDAGATHLWLIESVAALSPLLEVGDLIVPDDYIDGTRGQHYTYFDEKAGGYVQQVPPFDPASREALLAGALAVAARPTNHAFRRGVYVCVSNTRLETPAEAAFWARAGAHVAGRFLSPCLTLARELEMQVAVLACVTRTGGERGEPLALDAYQAALDAAIQAL